MVFHNRHNSRHPLVLPQDNHCVICMLTVCVLAFVFIFAQTSVILVLAQCLPLQELPEFILLTSFHLFFSHSHFLPLFLYISLKQGALGNCAFIHQFASLCPLYIFLSRAHTHPLVFCSQQWRLVSQSERERTFSKRLSGIKKEDSIAERVSVKDLLHYTCLLISLNHPFKIKVLISRIYFPK